MTPVREVLSKMFRTFPQSVATRVISPIRVPFFSELPGNILKHPALMKRPVFDLGTERLVGFDEDQRRAISKL